MTKAAVNKAMDAINDWTGKERQRVKGFRVSGVCAGGSYLKLVRCVGFWRIFHRE